MRLAVIILTAFACGAIVVMGIVLYVWTVIHRYTFEKMQNKDEMAAEAWRDYSEILDKHNESVIEKDKISKERDEAIMWNHQMAKELKEKYGVDEESTH